MGSKTNHGAINRQNVIHGHDTTPQTHKTEGHACYKKGLIEIYTNPKCRSMFT